MTQVKEICNRFIKDTVTDITISSDGHINETYFIKTRAGYYVCQKMQKGIDTEALKYNYRLYYNALKDFGLLFPKWINCIDGSGFYAVDQNNDKWRMYTYIQGDMYKSPLSKEILYACGQGLAKLHLAFQSIAERPIAVYPHIHDLNYYSDTFEKMISCNDHNKDLRDHVLEEKIYKGAERFLKLRLDRTQIVHGDTKLSNILFSDGEVKAIIDMDTFMNGSLLEDMADLIRSICADTGYIEESTAVTVMSGYLSISSGLLPDEEVGLLLEVTKKICFELGLRYYIDHISHIKVLKEINKNGSLIKAAKYITMALI